MPDSEPDITITLPLPPGSNKRLIPVVRKDGKPSQVLSPEARAWMAAAKLDVLGQRRRRCITNRAEGLVSLAPSNFDADAPIKLLFDALEKGGAVGNDKLIRPYTVRDDPTIRPGWLRVDLWDTGERFERTHHDTATKQDRKVEHAMVRTFGRGSRHGGGNRAR